MTDRACPTCSGATDIPDGKGGIAPCPDCQSRDGFFTLDGKRANNLVRIGDSSCVVEDWGNGFCPFDPGKAPQPTVLDWLDLG